VIRAHIERMGKEQRISRQAPVVIAHGSGEKKEHCRERQENISSSLMEIDVWICSSSEPAKKKKGRGNAQEQTFVRAAVREDGDSEAEEKRVAGFGAPCNSRQSAKNECASGGGNRAAPVAVHPIAGDAEFHRYQCSAQESPTRGHPRLQHPKNCGTHCRIAQQDADPRMAENLAEREDEALRRGIHRGIGREPIDMKSLEADPHGMRRIGQPAVDESIGHEEVAEFVVDSGHGDGQKRQDHQSNGRNTEEERANCQGSSRGKTSEELFDAAGNCIGSFRGEEGENADDEAGEECSGDCGGERGKCAAIFGVHFRDGS
jgi:hypothetical protein